jgi:sulfur carrier protein
MIQITINGQSRQLLTAITCEQLLADMALTGKRIAIERNGEIVPRGRYSETPLTDGDKLEIVVAVGGG